MLFAVLSLASIPACNEYKSNTAVRQVAFQVPSVSRLRKKHPNSQEPKSSRNAKNNTSLIDIQNDHYIQAYIEIFKMLALLKKS